MNDHTRKWVELLRSGEYEQGKRCLRTVNDTFCCLGVAADLWHKETGKGQWSVISEGAGSYAFEGEPGNPSEHMGGFLNETVLDWLGIPFGVQTTLASMNDHDGSFAEIADYIEANL